MGRERERERESSISTLSCKVTWHLRPLDSSTEKQKKILELIKTTMEWRSVTYFNLWAISPAGHGVLSTRYCNNCAPFNHKVKCSNSRNSVNALSDF